MCRDFTLRHFRTRRVGPGYGFQLFRVPVDTNSFAGIKVGSYSDVASYIIVPGDVANLNALDATLLPTYYTGAGSNVQEFVVLDRKAPITGWPFSSTAYDCISVIYMGNMDIDGLGIDVDAAFSFEVDVYHGNAPPYMPDRRADMVNERSVTWNDAFTQVVTRGVIDGRDAFSVDVNGAAGPSDTIEVSIVGLNYNGSSYDIQTLATETWTDAGGDMYYESSGDYFDAVAVLASRTSGGDPATVWARIRARDF